jgi:hypothetical protein
MSKRDLFQSGEDGGGKSGDKTMRKRDEVKKKT